MSIQVIANDDMAVLYCSVTMQALAGPVIQCQADYILDEYGVEYGARKFLEWLGPINAASLAFEELVSKYSEFLIEAEEEFKTKIKDNESKEADNGG